MGLLEKAQQKKKTLEEKPKPDKIEKKKETEIQKEETFLDKVEKAEKQPKGLLEKAIQKKREIYTEKISDKKKEEIIEEQKKAYSGITKDDKEKEIIEEKQGFGWKGLGTRRIVFDHDINEYVYELIEPVLTEDEEELKDELARLFKMLSDVNITEINEEEKAKYLEETLEQIIIDNNVKFVVKKKAKKSKKSSKGLFGKKKVEEETTEEEEPEPIEEKEEIDDKKAKKGSEKNKKELTQKEQELKDKIFYHIFREFLGYGKINIVMKDEGIEDISCDGQHVPLFIYHKKYEAIPTNIWFKDEKELDSFVVRLAQISGKQISIYSPIVDGKLPDGSRLQTTLAKTVTKGSTFTIRKFKEKPLTPVDLIDFKSLSLDMAAYFWMAIENGASILFCGGTASGKTTALNALSLFIPGQHKIISIEDTREVSLPHKNWIAGTTREGFSASDEKTGKDIDMFDLIRAALRQRPKVVMVGEVRGKEAYSLFQAMATGHTSYATVHASDIHTLIQRLENPPISLPRALLTSLDIIVFQNAVDIAGKTVRRMTSVTEVVKLDPDTNQLIFMEPFKWVSKTDDRFENAGASKILNDIKLQNDWTDAQLEKEINNRKLVLEWMLKNNVRDYKDVGRIVADYSKYPEQLLKKAKEEIKK
jgi:flagellar protein FlaI